MSISSSKPDLDLAKSAAWSWFERGSGTDKRPVREFYAARTKPEPKPSRYKLEVLMSMRNVASNSPNSSPKRSTSTACSSIPLLDKYDIERISHQLHVHMVSSYADHGRGISGSGGEAAKRTSEFCEKKYKGSWYRPRGVMCSVLNDMEGSSNLENMRRFPMKKGRRVTVVEDFGCRPRWSGRG